MIIEIVVHCQAIERPWYADLLGKQLEYFVRSPPTKCSLVVTVCLCDNDNLVNNVASTFAPRLSLNLIYLSKAELGRRAIGRNIASKESVGDVVWFTDCDYLIGRDTLDALAGYYKSWPDDVSMVFPNTVAVVKNGSDVSKTNYRAIGGIQIIRGEDAREFGYCFGRKGFQTPTDGQFVSCKCDRAFRGECVKRGRIVGVDIPGVKRLGHPRRKYK